MTPLITAFIICIVASAAIALAYYLRNSLKSNKRAVLAGIRILCSVVLILVFIQPSLHFSRIAPDERTVAVLIDASSSMRVFETDSIMDVIIPDMLRIADRNNLDDLDFAFFCFGDSTRPCPKTESIRFHDRRSLFPPFFDDPVLQKSQDIIVVSDGNWTNASAPRTINEDKRYWYAPLENVRQYPFITMGVSGTDEQITEGQPSEAVVRLSGFKAGKEPITLVCSSGGKTISRISLPLDSGFFCDTALIKLASGKSGTHLYEITATAASDSLYSEFRFVQQVLQKSFNVSIYSAEPSLDRRFITLALKRKNGWLTTDAAQADRPCDVTIIFDWDELAEKIVEGLPRNGSAVFVGAPPCANPVKITPPALRPEINPQYYSETLNHALGNLPPPSGIISCENPPFRTATTILSASVPGQNNAAGRDLPILFEALYMNRLVLILAVKGVWKWEFWPSSLEREYETPPFSDFLIEQIENLVRYNTNRSFYVFPEIFPIRETDSIPFRFVIPSHLVSGKAVDIRFAVTDPNGKTVLDSSISREIFGTYTSTAKFGLLPHGKYSYRCSLGAASGRTSFSDTLNVIKDDTEMQIQGQNRVFLGQFAAPLNLGDTSEVAGFLNDAVAESRKSATVPVTFQIRQSWPMLILLILLLLGEWFLRKIWRLD